MIRVKYILTFDAAFSTKTVEPGNWGGLSFCSTIPCSTRRVLKNVSCTQPVFITIYECSKSNENIVVMTTNTCYFRLDRV